MNRQTRKAEDISLCDSGKRDTIAVILLPALAAPPLRPRLEGDLAEGKGKGEGQQVTVTVKSGKKTMS